ncbi:dihydroorotase [Thermostichus vulcanus]|uniref:Dihydroorotase n=1 Tax=Thermostichus vulcanus str. 'Rupite' TaxID=2813851 RepID=A0ABT0C9J8_THEVL|nr:dihydroorotase [Thermostichus vulcanus]MCJ2542454.1 dihydroorotase [Thermostichus vulcanus str. 'Rupite']
MRLSFPSRVRLQGVRLLDPLRGWDQRTDVWIEEGQIRAMDAPRWREGIPEPFDLPADLPVLDASGWVMGPGLVDLYAHSGEPGHESRETLTSLAAAALAGGFTRVGILPTTDPVLDSAEQLGRYTRQDGDPYWLPWAALTLGAKGEQPSEWAELLQAGATGLTEDQPLRSLVLLRRALEYLRIWNKPLMLWPWDPGLAGSGSLYEGVWALRLGLKGIPASAETAALARILEVIRSESVTTPVHFMRISQARSLQLIQQAQQEGWPVTASTTWMHLLLDEQAVLEQDYNPNLHLLPPLPTASDRQALIDGIRAGTLAIATDHRPYTYEEKTVPFADAPVGAIGLELALPLLWHNLVERGSLTALQLWAALSLHPARCLGWDPLPLQPGSATDWVIFDPSSTWMVSASTLKSGSLATPWLGKPIQGRVLHTHVGTAQPTG